MTSRIAYYCMEFGLHAELPIYSGGLGVLAGDLIKAARDGSVPLTAVGLLWNEGYTVQSFDEQGRPEDRYPKTSREGLEPLDPRVEVEIYGEPVVLRAWRCDRYGNAPLILLEPERPEEQWITARLYQGGRRARLAQEMVLGVGGVRMVEALGIEVDLHHLNEGHGVPVGLELMRRELLAGTDLDTARSSVRKHIVFTTHTPVPAGNEEHPVEALLEAGFGLGVFSAGDMEALGGSPFNMTVAALGLSCRANAVSALHGEVAQGMWSSVEDAPPIGHVTNGVHVGTWQDPQVGAALDGGDMEALQGARKSAKQRLLKRIEGHTACPWPEDALLLGFARRAAPYKRADLILRHEDRLRALVEAGTLRLVFAGKAHPDDHRGKDIVQSIVQFARAYPEGVAYLPAYDMALAAELVQGVDVWLNNPIRPREASGTSGMKAALNGAPNLSIPDGWWAEGCEHGVNGWSFGGEVDGDEADEADALALMNCLEQEVLPAFADPEKWMGIARSAAKSALQDFSAARMVEDYKKGLWASG